MTETLAHISANSVPKISPAMGRQIRATRRDLRRMKRGADAIARERSWLALKSLTELQGDPLRSGLAVQVAMNVKRAG
jgi:hypothetical protein